MDPTLLLLACVAALSQPVAVPQPSQPITLASLLTEMTDREAVARFPDPPYTCRQFSSYDRASISPANPDAWFANDDFNKFLRVDESRGRREWVMADMDGPGAIVRLWSANPKGNLRIYLDGAAQPVIEAPMADVLGGKWKIGEPLSGVRARGYNLYLPIPYAKHCTITSDADGFYYQVNYRTYPAGTVIMSPAAADLAGSPAIPSAGAKLVAASVLQPFRSPTSAATFKGIGAGQTIDIRMLGSSTQRSAAGSAIRSVNIYFERPPTAQELRSTIIRAEFDGEETIWAPLSDFFGVGIDSGTQMHDWYRLATKEGLRCEWVMPFKSAARIWLENLGTTTAPFHGVALVSDMAWNERTMHFHASWHSQRSIHAFGGRGTVDWNYIDITGKGVYVGDSLAVMNPVEAWWGEGDEKIYVDGEAFPSHFGTGTEDYYGYAWCDPHVFMHPFHSQPRVDGNGRNNWGHTTVNRVRSLDAIPFNTSLKFDMEIWHWAQCDEAYAATTFWYALPGATCNRPPQPEEAAAAIPQPPPLPTPMVIGGALECETMKVAEKSEGLTVVAQDMRGFGKSTWSNDRHLWVQGRRIGDFVELLIPVTTGLASPQRVVLHATKSWDYGIVRFTINGQPAGPQQGAPIDLCSGEHTVLVTGAIDLGVFTPRPDGTLLFRAEVVAHNPKAEGSKSMFGLDCIVLSATPANAAP